MRPAVGDGKFGFLHVGEQAAFVIETPVVDRARTARGAVQELHAKFFLQIEDEPLTAERERRISRAATE
jgi:hypothetical protein